MESAKRSHAPVPLSQDISVALLRCPHRASLLLLARALRPRQLARARSSCHGQRVPELPLATVVTAALVQISTTTTEKGHAPVPLSQDISVALLRCPHRASLLLLARALRPRQLARARSSCHRQRVRELPLATVVTAALVQISTTTTEKGHAPVRGHALFLAE